MKRYSNLVLAFTIAVAATFLTWVGWLIFVKVVKSSEVKIEKNFESLLNEQNNISSQQNKIVSG